MNACAKIIQDRAFANEKICLGYSCEEIVGNEMVVTGVKARNVKTDEVSEIEANGVFIYVGLDPLTEPFKKLVLRMRLVGLKQTKK